MIGIDREQVLKWDIEQLWNMTQLIEQDENTNRQDIQEIQQIKTGYKIKVPIYYFIQEWFEVYPNTKRAKILGYNKYDIKDFMEEIETRNKNMRQIIINNIEDNDATEAR